MNCTSPKNMPETPSTRRPTVCKGGLFQANLKAYLDGETSALRGWLVRGHLAQCAECREELRWLRRLGEDMKELESTRPRPELRARILASLPTTPPARGIQVIHSRPDRERSPQFVPRLALASGLAMLLAFCGVFSLNRFTASAASGKPNSQESARLNPHPLRVAQNPVETLVQTPSAMDMVTYTPEEDPNNALADQMFRKKMNKIEEEKRVLGQDDWHRLLAQARAVARKASPITPSEMGITLAVPNIAEMRAHLPTWAKQEGATLIAAGKPDPTAIDRTTVPSLRNDDSPANLIAFSVPAEHGPAFLGALKQLGQISILPLPTKSAASASAQPATHIQTEPKYEGVLRAIPAFPIVNDTDMPVKKNTVAHENHTKAGRYLVLTILLTTAHN